MSPKALLFLCVFESHRSSRTAESSSPPGRLASRSLWCAALRRAPANCSSS